MRVTLRALEPEDLSFLYHLENESSLWKVSDSYQPFSKHILKEYIKNAHRSIYETYQFRWVISMADEVIGCIDLYDFDVRNLRAFVSVAVLSPFRGKGYGGEALQLLEQYAQEHLHLHQLSAYVLENNRRCISFFERNGYEKTVCFKQWIRVNNRYVDQYLYQKIFL